MHVSLEMVKAIVGLKVPEREVYGPIAIVFERRLDHAMRDLEARTSQNLDCGMHPGGGLLCVDTVVDAHFRELDNDTTQRRRVKRADGFPKTTEYPELPLRVILRTMVAWICCEAERECVSGVEELSALRSHLLAGHSHCYWVHLDILRRRTRSGKIWTERRGCDLENLIVCKHKLVYAISKLRR